MMIDITEKGARLLCYVTNDIDIEYVLSRKSEFSDLGQAKIIADLQFAFGVDKIKPQLEKKMYINCTNEDVYDNNVSTESGELGPFFNSYKVKKFIESGNFPSELKYLFIDFDNFHKKCDFDKNQIDKKFNLEVAVPRMYDFLATGIQVFSEIHVEQFLRPIKSAKPIIITRPDDFSELYRNTAPGKPIPISDVLKFMENGYSDRSSRDSAASIVETVNRQKERERVEREEIQKKSNFSQDVCSKNMHGYFEDFFTDL